MPRALRLWIRAAFGRTRQAGSGEAPRQAFSRSEEGLMQETRLRRDTLLCALTLGLAFSASRSRADDCDRNGVEDRVDLSRTLFAARVLSR
jgi:hypothetical protein